VFLRWYRHRISEALDECVRILIDVARKICWRRHCSVDLGKGVKLKEIRLSTVRNGGAYVITLVLPSSPVQVVFAEVCIHDLTLREGY